MYNEAIKGALEKTEVLEKYLKTVTLRAESLVNTETHTSSKHFSSARRRRSGVSMICLHNCSTLAASIVLCKQGKHTHALGHTRSTRLGLLQHGKRVRRVVVRRPPPPFLIDELCSESSESSNTADATTARWYEAFTSRVAPSQ